MNFFEKKVVNLKIFAERERREKEKEKEKERD
jgi:hypothetical protein